MSDPSHPYPNAIAAVQAAGSNDYERGSKIGKSWRTVRRWRDGQAPMEDWDCFRKYPPLLIGLLLDILETDDSQELLDTLASRIDVRMSVRT